MATRKENEQIFSRLNITRWHNAGYTGKGVRVAIIDEGWKPSPYYPNGYYPLGDGRNESGHCTTMHGCLGEVAPDAEFLFFYGPTTENLQWIKDNNIDIVVMSLNGGTDFRILQNTEIPIFIAAGNNGPKIADPADEEFVFAVGAWEYNDQKANYSNVGPELDFVSYIPYIKVSETEYYKPYGTSFATPFAAGICALFIQRCKELGIKPTRQQVKDFLIKYALDSVSFGVDDYSGHGIVALPKEILPKRIDVNIGTNKAFVDGTEQVLDLVVPTINGRTVVPLRFFGEALGCQVEYDGLKRVATVIRF